MKKARIALLFSLSFFFFTAESQAQDYTLAGGVRLGYPTSLSLKYFITESSALEGFVGRRGYSYLSFGYRSNVVGGAYLMHFPLEIDELPGLKWYVGAGASMFIYSYDNGIADVDRVDSSLALHAFGGLDYALEDVPINISVDWSPTLIFRGLDSGVFARNASVAVRYILIE